MKKIYLLLVALMVTLTINATDYYLRGSYNNWKADAASMFTESTTTSGLYTLKISGKFENGADGFKIADENWHSEFGSNGSNVTIGTSYTLGSSGNIKIDLADGKALQDPTFTFNPSTNELLVEGTVVDADEGTYSYGLHGSFADGSTWATTNMTEGGDDTWTATITVGASAEFGVKRFVTKSSVTTGAGWYSAAAGTSITANATSEITLTTSGSNISIAAGTYTFTLTPSTMTLKVVPATETGIALLSAESVPTKVQAYNIAGQPKANAKGLSVVDGKKYIGK